MTWSMTSHLIRVPCCHAELASRRPSSRGAPSRGCWCRGSAPRSSACCWGLVSQDWLVLDLGFDHFLAYFFQKSEANPVKIDAIRPEFRFKSDKLDWWNHHPSSRCGSRASGRACSCPCTCPSTSQSARGWQSEGNCVVRGGKTIWQTASTHIKWQWRLKISIKNILEKVLLKSSIMRVDSKSLLSTKLANIWLRGLGRLATWVTAIALLGSSKPQDSYLALLSPNLFTVGSRIRQADRCMTWPHICFSELQKSEKNLVFL